MCGLVGYIEYKNTIEHSSNIIESMANSISHRGPDLGESYIDRSHSLFIGFRRLLSNIRFVELCQSTHNL